MIKNNTNFLLTTAGLCTLFIFTTLILMKLLPNYNLYDYFKEIRLKSIEEKQNKSFDVVCKKCNGTGETEQDINLLMSEASFAIWYNSHINSKKCKVCKDKFCNIAQKKYDETMSNYKKLGPKKEMAICPDCMGMGSYTQHQGYRVGREKL